MLLVQPELELRSAPVLAYRYTSEIKLDQVHRGFITRFTIALLPDSFSDPCGSSARSICACLGVLIATSTSAGADRWQQTTKTRRHLTAGAARITSCIARPKRHGVCSRFKSSRSRLGVGPSNPRLPLPSSGPSRSWIKPSPTPNRARPQSARVRHLFSTKGTSGANEGAAVRARHPWFSGVPRSRRKSPEHT